MARCFIGFMIPEELKGYIEGVKQDLAKLQLRCKFVERENLHVCLSFLGEIEDSKINEIETELSSICSQFSGFGVTVAGIKIIPNENFIRVLALEIIDETSTMEKLIPRIRKTIGGDSHPAHLTLCRIKSVDDKKKVVEEIKGVTTESKSMLVSSIQLIKSELKRSGPVYSSIYEAKLQ